jgi:type VI secretion system secreted protein VgrG
LPGFTFRLEGHEIEGLNREYLVTEVLHEGSQPQVLQEQSGGGGSGYANRFRAVGSSVTLRPELRTRKPRIRGAQTAIVTGPAGEEIYTDGHGRVKVQFHWDRRGGRDERSSCWLRVSNGWAGGGYGGVYLPRVGQEVIVGFLEGDPDRPMVTGRVYHGLNRPPYALPAEKTKSTLKSDSSLGGGGSNELRFEDRKGAEEVYLHGQKDWTIGIENDKNQRIGHDESLSVGRNRAKRVGVDQSETIGANKTIAVGVDHIEAIGANMSLAVGLNKTETVAINTAESVGVAKALTIGGLYQVTVGGAVNETVGGAKAEEVGLVRALLVGRDVLESVGGDMAVKVAVDLKESVGDTHTLNAKEILIDADTQIELTCGSAKITLKKGGDIRLEGKEITVKGSGNITLKGGKILKKSGSTNLESTPASLKSAGSAKRLSRSEVSEWLKEQYPKRTSETDGAYEKRINSHLESIDWSKDVERIEFSSGDRVEMWIRKEGKPGLYATTPGTPPEKIGINLFESQRVKTTFEVQKPFSAIKSAAADFPTGKISGVGGSGGGVQFQLPSNAHTFMKKV